MENRNIIYLTDSYKISHHLQYPKGTQTVYSYFESRGGAFNETVFFGLQAFLKKYLVGQVVTMEDIDKAEKVFKAHFGSDIFNREGWEYIVNKHDGKLPICIKAVPEGTVVQGQNVLMTVENTDPNAYWLTNYLETLLVQVWYPTTVATYSRECKKVINEYLKKTSDVAPEEQIGFKLHDFGFRGVSSVETAGIGGAAHLVNFLGTDTVAGLLFAMEYYNSDMPGFSIPAAEHSTVTSWKYEVDAFENMLKQFGNGLVAVVSDSFDIYKACRELWGEKLKDKVLNMEGSLVVRPDSGDPADVVLNVLNILGDKFGYEVNSKGFKVLNPKVRVIQGDGIDLKEIDRILSNLAINQWSADNVAFGSGGGLLQKHNRDTLKFAFKCSSITVNDTKRDVYKKPVTATWKKSKKGKMRLLKTVDGNYVTECTSADGTTEFHNYDGETGINAGSGDQLRTVFLDGELVVDQDFDEIRKRASL